MEPSIYNKTNPFFAAIKERYNLTLPGSKKNTQHVVLDIKGSGLTYETGDSIGIFPSNSEYLVNQTIRAMRTDATTLVIDKQTGQGMTIRDFLTRKANLTDLSKKLLSIIADQQTNLEKKEALQEILAEGAQDKFRAYLESHELWDALEENHEVRFPLQELCNMLMPLLPRLYSISSSMSVVGDEVHLTIGVLKYHTNGYQRVGVCTHYLCEMVPLNTPIVPIYIQPHHGFTLPKDSNVPMIMIGPGTGVAPFRAFLQERVSHNAEGKNWLFFGECNRATDFFYEDYWTDLVKKGKLNLDVAFSRDQPEKVYVQHRMIERGKEFYQWLMEGAYIYVCGDASRMAKDVEATLLEIIKVHGQKEDTEAKAFIKKLRAEKRYLRDVY